METLTSTAHAYCVVSISKFNNISDPGSLMIAFQATG